MNMDWPGRGLRFRAGAGVWVGTHGYRALRAASWHCMWHRSLLWAGWHLLIDYAKKLQQNRPIILINIVLV